MFIVSFSHFVIHEVNNANRHQKKYVRHEPPKLNAQLKLRILRQVSGHDEKCVQGADERTNLRERQKECGQNTSSPRFCNGEELEIAMMTAARKAMVYSTSNAMNATSPEN